MSTVIDPQPTSAAAPGGRLLLSGLLRRDALDGAGQALGRVIDVIVRLREDDYPAVTGLVASIGGRHLFVPATEIVTWDSRHIELASARLDLRPFERRVGEVLLHGDVLGHRLVDIEQPRLVTAHDVEFGRTKVGWIAKAVDIAPRGLLHLRRGHTWRDWSGFEALIGHDGSAPSRLRLGRLHRLKPAQLADIIEEASDSEQQELLSRVHAHPELEADVFEELDEDEAGDLLEARTDAQIADVLSRMRSEDAADALLDLPQERRMPVLGLLPKLVRERITILLGYQEATAGGLMGVDYLSFPPTSTVADAIRAISQATRIQQPEAIMVAFCHDEQRRLVGAVNLVALLQSDPRATLGAVADPHPVHVHADADLPEVTLAMADYNLIVLPVVDEHDRLIGVLTCDNVLEAAVADEWRRRRP